MVVGKVVAAELPLKLVVDRMLGASTNTWTFVAHFRFQLNQLVTFVVA